MVESGEREISVSRSIWENQTTELGLETTIYHSISDWLNRTNFIRLKEDGEQAEFHLKGEIMGIDYPEISYGTGDIATELRVNLNVFYQLIENTDNKVVWESTKTFTEPYLQGTTPGMTQQNKDAALATIADDIAEEIYLRLIDKVITK